MLPQEQVTEELADRQLLQRFIEVRSEAAFAALVSRHGPLVWGVCRRLLNHHDAEEAFQATFLVLARKAKSILPVGILANWLHGVAHRTALHARRSSARRTARERQVTDMPEPAIEQQEVWHEVEPVLDRELSRLPEKYRVVIIMCDLEDKTRKEVARELGCPEGTVAGRLVRGRAMLARRIARHGVLVSGASLATMLSESLASAAAPSSVVSATISAASSIVAGQVAATSIVSTQAVALTDGVLKGMLLTKLKLTAGVLLAVSVVGLGGVLLVLPLVAATDPRTEKDKETIQGTWVLVNLEQVGIEPQENPDGKFKVVITGNEISYPDKSAGKFELDATKTPNRIQLTEIDGTTTSVPGIYSLEGDELRWCFGRIDDLEPPASFDVKEAPPGKFPTSWIFRREKDATSEKAEGK